MSTPTVPSRQSFAVAGGRGLPVPLAPVRHDPTPRTSYRPPGWDRLPPLEPTPAPRATPRHDAVLDALADKGARSRGVTPPRRGRDTTVRAPRPRHGLDEATAAQLVADYRDGLGLIPAARRYGVRQETARRILVDASVTIRPRGGRTKRATT